MTPVQDILDHSGDAVFGVDRQRRVGYTNAAFRKLLKREAAEIHGRPCYEILCASDLAGRRVCGPDCPIAHEAMRHRSMQHFDLVLPRGDEHCWVNTGVYPVPSPSARTDRPRVYFALRPMNGHRLIQRLAAEIPGPATERRACTLTRRETQVLELAARGEDTAGIAQELSIAPQTVRNHFKNIFSRLQVRSRAQAVALALQQRML